VSSQASCQGNSHTHTHKKKPNLSWQ